MESRGTTGSDSRANHQGVKKSTHISICSWRTQHGESIESLPAGLTHLGSLFLAVGQTPGKSGFGWLIVLHQFNGYSE